MKIPKMTLNNDETTQFVDQPYDKAEMPGLVISDSHSCLGLHYDSLYFTAYLFYAICYSQIHIKFISQICQTVLLLKHLSKLRKTFRVVTT